MNEERAAQELRGSFIESVLLTMRDNDGAMTQAELDDLTGDPMATRDALVELHERRLIEQPSTAGGRLTPFGSRTANLIKRSLLTGQRRADVVQRKLLGWLISTYLPSSVDRFVKSPDASDSDVAFTSLEIWRARDLLLDRGFIELPESAYLSIRVTAAGHAALMSTGLISEYGQPHATTVTNDYSSRVTLRDHANAGGVISGGHGHTQSIVQTVGAAESSKISSKASELLSLVDQLPDESEELRGALEQLRDEAAASTPRKSVLKELVHKALGAAATSAGTAAGQQILAGIAGVAQLLP